MVQNRERDADNLLLSKLLAGARVADAAVEAGVSERTVFRRLQDPAFRADLAEQRQKILDATVVVMTNGALDAARVLGELVGSEAPPGVRLAAARAVIELSIRMREHAQISARTDAIDRVLNDRMEP